MKINIVKVDGEIKPYLPDDAIPQQPQTTEAEPPEPDVKVCKYITLNSGVKTYNFFALLWFQFVVGVAVFFTTMFLG